MAKNPRHCSPNYILKLVSTTSKYMYRYKVECVCVRVGALTLLELAEQG